MQDWHTDSNAKLKSQRNIFCMKRWLIIIFGSNPDGADPRIQHMES